MTRIQELFFQALEVPLEQRDEWLSRECGTFEKELRELLKQDSRTRGFLDEGLGPRALQSIGMAVGRNGALLISCPRCSHEVEFPLNGDLDCVTCTQCSHSIELLERDRTSESEIKHRDSIGRFQIVERIGEGASATVFKAKDLKLDRIVALKIPRKSSLSSVELKRFLREARTAAILATSKHRSRTRGGQ